MFIGHFAVALATKPGVPRVPLGWLFAACQLPDLVWPVMLLTGAERVRIALGDTAFTPMAFEHYPWTHSLLLDAGWGLLLGLLYWSRGRDRRGGIAIGLLVVSHWFLDWVTHRPDLPLVPPPLPGSEVRAGLGLWNSVPGTLAVELVLFAVGVLLYSKATIARDRIGRLALAGLVAFLLVIYVANAVSPPPPNVTAVAIGGFALWLLVWWGAWADRHRRAHGVTPA